MGLKSGSRDAGLDDSDDTESERRPKSREQVTSGANREHMESSSSERAAAGSEQKNNTDSTDAGQQRPSMESIPYKLRRSKVNEGREQVPYFLREKVIEGESSLQDTLEELLGESVYKSDYREAAMVVAQRNPELVAKVLREWGYDLDMA